MLLVLVVMGPVWTTTRSRLVELLTSIVAVHRYVVVIGTTARHTARRRTATTISATPVASLHHTIIIVRVATRSAAVRTVVAPVQMMMTTSILCVFLKLFEFTLFALQLLALSLKSLSECRQVALFIVTNHAVSNGALGFFSR